MNARPIVFASDMGSDRWGGSEKLWAGTALNLRSKGVAVAAKVQYWPTPHPAVVNLIKNGVDVSFRRFSQPLWKRGWHKLSGRSVSQYRRDLEEFIIARRPVLVVLNSGTALPPLDYVELCGEINCRFVTVAHNNYVHWWPADEEGARYRSALERAEQCYFVSDSNLRCLETQLGCQLRNAEIVHNPFGVPFDASPSWPSMDDKRGLKLAFVGRLYPPAKGQDLLLKALAGSAWRQRKWFLTLYGEGSMRCALEQLVDRLGLQDRVEFAGFVNDIEKIWSANHLLTMPSRFEGMPLTIVEAMLCGRSVVATDVGGIPEIVEDGATGFLADAPTVDAVRIALERAWERRFELKQMGDLAAKRVRKRVPRDPIKEFSEKIMAIAQATGEENLVYDQV